MTSTKQKMFHIGLVIFTSASLMNVCYAGLDKAFKNLVHKEETRLLEHYGLQEKPKPVAQAPAKKQVSQPQSTQAVAKVDATNPAAQPEHKGKGKRKKNQPDVA